MAAIVETFECYPRGVWVGGIHLAEPLPADHEHCPGGQTTPGVIGGWRCPCPCHRSPDAPERPLSASEGLEAG